MGYRTDVKARIEVSTTLGKKMELKALAKEKGLTLSAYLVLKGLNQLKEEK